MQLAEDIHNYLEQRPLIAGPETSPYRIRKFVAKRKAPLATAAAILVLLVGGVIGTGLGFVGQRQMRIAADTLRVRAEGLPSRPISGRRRQRQLKSKSRGRSRSRIKHGGCARLRTAEAAARAEALSKYEAIKQAKAAKNAALTSTSEKDQATHEREAAEQSIAADVTAKDQALDQRNAIASENYFANILAAQAACAPANGLKPAIFSRSAPLRSGIGSGAT